MFAWFDVSCCWNREDQAQTCSLGTMPPSSAPRECSDRLHVPHNLFIGLKFASFMLISRHCQGQWARCGYNSSSARLCSSRCNLGD